MITGTSPREDGEHSDPEHAGHFARGERDADRGSPASPPQAAPASSSLPTPCALPQTGSAQDWLSVRSSWADVDRRSA